MLKRVATIFVVLLTYSLFLPLTTSAIPIEFYYSNVYYENRGFDSLTYPSLLPFNRIFSDVLLRDTGDYTPGGISVNFTRHPDLSTTKLSFFGATNLGGIFYNVYTWSSINNPTLSDWENKLFYFYVDGWLRLRNSFQVIMEDSLRKLDFVTPISITGNTISWNPVSAYRDDAFIRYRVRINNLDSSGNPTGFPIFDSPDLTATSFTFDPLPPGMVVGKEYALRIEAREFFYYYQSFGMGDFLNRSSYFTKFTPVPIPSTFVLLGVGLIGLAGLRRRFRR